MMSSSLFEVEEHLFKGQHIREYHQGLVLPNNPPSLIAKQYTPKSNLNPQPGDITIIAALGVGLVKELAEPLFEDLTTKCHDHGIKIRGIWIVDMYNMGGNALLNQNAIGNDPSWFDHSRDLLCMINQFSHLMPSPIFGLGHSMGGAQITYLSHIHPRLFHSLILIEPAIWKTSLQTTEKAYTVQHTRAMAFRRETFPSLHALHASLAKSPYYKTWDKRALARLIEYGYAIQADGTVKSTISIHSDLTLMGRPNLQGVGNHGAFEDVSLAERRTVPDVYPSNNWYAPFYRAEPDRLFEMLPNLRPSVLYVVGTRVQNPEERVNRERLATTGTGWGGSGGVEKGRVRQVVVQDGGHLMVLDGSLGEVVEAAAGWIESEIGVWREVERENATSEWMKRRDGDKFKIEERLWDIYTGKMTAEDIVKGKL